MITGGSGCCPFLNDIPFVEGIHKAIFVNFRKLSNDPDWDSRRGHVPSGMVHGATGSLSNLQERCSRFIDHGWSWMIMDICRTWVILIFSTWPVETSQLHLCWFFLHHAHGISIAFLVCVLEVKSPPVLRSGEPFDESLGQGAFFLSWNIRIQMWATYHKQLQGRQGMAHISHALIFGVVNFKGFATFVSTKTSMIFAGVIGISYHLFILILTSFSKIFDKSWLKKIVAPNSRWRVGSRWISLKTILWSFC